VPYTARGCPVAWIVIFIVGFAFQAWAIRSGRGSLARP
jgi:hypothetical protein